MVTRPRAWTPPALVLAAALVLGCGGDGTDADRKGIGAQCTKADDCRSGQQCLAFKGGYCGLADCMNDAACPEGSACVRHTDGRNYCFRVCADKPDCNRHRAVEVEANCSSNVTFVEGNKSRKACVPPSGT